MPNYNLIKLLNARLKAHDKRMDSIDENDIKSSNKYKNIVENLNEIITNEIDNNSNNN